MGRSQQLLRNDGVDHVGFVFDAGEFLVEALEFVGEATVIDAEEVEDGGVHVADVDGVLSDVVGEVVGFSVNRAPLDAASGHPDGETAGMVIASVVGAAETSLTVDGATEFSAPDDEGVVEQAAVLEVLDEGVAGLVDVAGLQGEISGEVSVLIPTAMENLGEADSALGEAAGEETVVGRRCRGCGRPGRSFEAWF